VAVTAAQALAYLTALGLWRDQRKRDLDALDAAALASPDPSAHTADLVVSMALWKAIADRCELLTATFDSGRVGPAEAERLSTLIWGRMDVQPGGAAPGAAGASSAAGALAVSLPEACRLCDAMTSSLRARLSLEPSEAEAGARLGAVRAGVERIRDQVGLAPAGAARDAARSELTRLEQRVIDVTDRARRGADVGGLLGPLEVDTATLERDLIVASAQRLDTQRQRERAAGRRAELAARAGAVRALEQQVLAAVTPAPTLAVPDVTALGEVPAEAAALTAYLARLENVGRALDRAHGAYAGALAAREETVGLAGALTAQAQAADLPAAAARDLEAIGGLLRQVLEATPIDLTRAASLLAAFQSYLSTSTRKASR
jgi:hypothetical protein